MENDNIEVGEVITLAEEDGDEEMDFRVMYQFDIEGKTYLCLVPVDQEDQEEYDVHFLRYDGSDVLEPITDEDEWQNVEQTFEALMAQEEEEEEEEL